MNQPWIKAFVMEGLSVTDSSFIVKMAARSLLFIVPWVSEAQQCARWLLPKDAFVLNLRIVTEWWLCDFTIKWRLSGWSRKCVRVSQQTSNNWGFVCSYSQVRQWHQRFCFWWCFSSNANMEKPWVLVIHSSKNTRKKIIFPNQIDRLIFKLRNMWLYM